MKINAIIFLLISILFIKVKCNGQNIVIQYDTFPKTVSKHKKRFEDYKKNCQVKNRTDSIKIMCDEGFTNDTLEVDVDTNKFLIKICKTSTVGYAGGFYLPKNKDKEKITLKLNSISFSDFYLDKRYPILHIDYMKDKKLKLIYTDKTYVYF